MKILLATDGTKYGQRAAEMVCKFDLGPNDSLKIISVVDLALPLAIDVYGGYLPDTAVLEKAARENATKVVAETESSIRERFGDTLAIETDTLFGSPESRIVETAEEMKADIIVLGSHGYKRWERILLGSVSNSVVLHAHCSVLVVRSPAE